MKPSNCVADHAKIRKKAVIKSVYSCYKGIYRQWPYRHLSRNRNVIGVCIRLGLTVIAPITEGGNNARFNGFAVPLMGTGIETQDVVLENRYPIGRFDRYGR